MTRSSTSSSPRARRGRGSCPRAARSRSPISAATRRSTASSTTPHDHAERYCAHTTMAAQRNIFLTTGSVLRSNEGRPLLEIVDDTCGRHDTIGGACSQESNTLRYGHHTKHQHACVENFLFEGAQVGPRQARSRQQHQLVHERAGRARRHDGDRRRDLGARSPRRVPGRARRAGAHQQLPADQQSLQRVRPNADRRRRHRPLRRAAVFDKVLVANRGEIACRIIATLRRMGVPSVAVYSDADAATLPGAPRRRSGAHRAGTGRRELSRRGRRDLSAALERGAQAIHPGYGFLAERADFAERSRPPGSPSSGRRPNSCASSARSTPRATQAAAAGVPLLPGSAIVTSVDDALEAAAGGRLPGRAEGDRGRWRHRHARLPRSPPQLADSLEGVNRQAGAAFGDERVYLERWLANARHVEVQIVGDGTGRIVTLGDRDCSTQRRNQKVLEETPAPGLPDALRARMLHAAEQLAASVSYRSAGTVEFLVDVPTDTARIPRSERALAGRAHGDRDRVGNRPRRVDGPHRGRRRERARRRSGAARPCDRSAHLRREPMARPRAERRNAHDRVVSRRRARRHVGGDRQRGHGQLRLAPRQGDHARRRRAPRRSIGSAPRSTRRGSRASPRTSISCARSSSSPAFADGAPVHVAARERRARRSRGRGAHRRHAHHGAGPSGPARILVGRCAAERPDGRPLVPDREPDRRERRRRSRARAHRERAALAVPHRGDGLPRGRADRRRHRRSGAPDVGARRRRGGRDAHRRRDRPARRPRVPLVRGGIDVAPVLGSASTFTLGGFGGYAGRALRTGDVLHLGADAARERSRRPSTAARRPRSPIDWEIAVLVGPHGDEEFLTPADIDRLLRDRLARPPQLRAHRRAPRRSEPGVGARRRRRRRAASVEHPRHRVLRRLDRLHRRRPDHPRARRSEPRRLRVPGGRRRRATAGSSGQLRPEDRALRSREPRRRRRAARGEQRAAATACARRSGPARRPRRSARLVATRRPAGPRCNGDAAARTTCSSSTGRWCSISSCASGPTRCNSGSRQPSPAGSST